MNIWLSIYLLGVCVSFIVFLNSFNFGFGDEEPTQVHLFLFCLLCAVFWPFVVVSVVLMMGYLLGEWALEELVKFLLTPIPLGERKAS